MKQILDYKFEDFISDETFMDYAKGINSDNIKIWERILKENPEKSKIAYEASEFVRAFCFKKKELPKQFIDREWKQLNERLNISNQKATDKIKKLKTQFWQYAAVFIILIGLAGSVFLMDHIFNTNKIAYNEITTTKGQIKNVLLPDGSLVFLNSDTKLKYGSNFGARNREVFLEGEAFFDVTKDSHKPFVVYTTENTVKVLGTAFNVSAYPDENIHQISLERGKISVSEKGKSHVLDVNQTYLLLRNKKQSKIFKTENIEMYSSWKEGRIIFRNQRLADIVRKLERSHNINIDLQNKQLEDYRYTGEFSISDDIRKIFEIINMATLINYEIKEDTIYIR